MVVLLVESAPKIDWTSMTGECRNVDGGTLSGSKNLFSDSTAEQCQAACSNLGINYDSLAGSGVRACEHRSNGECLAYTGMVRQGSGEAGATCYLPIPKATIQPNWSKSQGRCRLNGSFMSKTELFYTGN